MYLSAFKQICYFPSLRPGMVVHKDDSDWCVKWSVLGFVLLERCYMQFNV